MIPEARKAKAMLVRMTAAQDMIHTCKLLLGVTLSARKAIRKPPDKALTCISIKGMRKGAPQSPTGKRNNNHP
jgi:hypothetical protein